MSARPRLLFYCQHLIGVGHLTRSLALCRALVERFDVVFVQGGPDIGRTIPSPAFQHLRLPPLLMVEASGALYDPGGARDVSTILAERAALLASRTAATCFDVVVTELFPFGRRKFAPEILGMLRAVRTVNLRCVVACSLRDILVEKPDGRAREEKMVRLVLDHYDRVLVHSDPSVLHLDDTFNAVDPIRDRLVYTGFVAEPRGPDAAAESRETARQPEVLISTGGAGVGGELAAAVLSAVPHFPELCFRFVVSPAFPDGVREELTAAARRWGAGRVRLEPFLEHFEDELRRVALSISLAGYNTVMNLVQSGVPALVWPHPVNREQGLRAERFARAGRLRVLAREDLHPDRIAGAIRAALAFRPATSPVALDGAARTAEELWRCGAAEGIAGVQRPVA